jgi:tetratricopeptide (TPR) repeat protein
LNRLAAANKELGRLELAEGDIKAALRLHQACQDQSGEAQDLLVQGSLHLLNGDYVSARDHAGEALEIFQRLKLRLWEGYTWLELGLAQESLGDLTKAAAAYGQMQTIQQSIGSGVGQLDALAGMARCLLAEGKTDLARLEMESNLAKIKQDGTTGIKYPIRLYLTAYWVLQAATRKAQALAALRDGYALLQKRADGIEDSHLRALYLEKVPENKELVVQLRQHDPPAASIAEED